ncbi:hypothetical protein AQUCO_02500346v1 [Aquilegia coerulea]|uniref:Cytochrome P450 n=1 Tax=Aquilegia coerulea TaxID=218851 RepID=A0A2G5DAM7_AQUCA|nr:hypothetical protein AQUCO_02500346v1 [Aquilegia coerulea]
MANKSSKKKKAITYSFTTYPILGNLPDFLINRHRFLDWVTYILSNKPTNTLTFRRPGKIQGVITANPLNVEYMLKTNFENYPKGDRFIILLKGFLGRGIFNSDGDLWKIQRKVASFEFSTKSLRTFVIDNVRLELQARLIPLLIRASRMNKVIDIQDLLERFAFDNVCKVAFNEDPACLGGDGTSGSEFMRAFEDAATLSAGRFMYAFPLIWILKKIFNIGSEKRLRESSKIVHEFAEKIIKARIQDKEITQKSDLLSRFIATNDENSTNSLEFLRDIVISFILAGRDTTSSALSWFFWLLSSRPDIERNILEEITAIRTSSGKCIGDTFELDELRQMHYLHAAISEAMRLYPPVAVDTKACLKDDVMPDGTFVGEGWFVTYSAFSMGRMEKIWGKDCNEYVPERWLENNGTFRPESPFKYPAFHAGPRMCLGKDMAYIQMKSIAASVIEKFEMDVVDKTTCPHHVLSLTLRMKDGLMVKVKERSNSVIDS